MKNHFFLLLIAILSQEKAYDQTKVQVPPEDYPRKNEIVTLYLQKPVSPKKYYELVNTKTGKIYPAQCSDSVTIIFILSDSIPAGKTETLQLRPASSATRQLLVSIEKNDSGLMLKSHQKPVFFYHTKIVMPPPDSPLIYQKSGFIHPLYSPDGKVLTDDFPSSHAHQHGIFMAWTNTTFKKEHVDFWNHHLQKGSVAHSEVLEITNGPVFGRIKTRLSHRSTNFGEVLVDDWTITVYPFSNYFVFDLYSEQRNVTADTLFLNKYNYGGMAFRGTKVWDQFNKRTFQNNWQVLTSEGIRDSMANHTHARWVDASGKIDDKMNGVTVFSHPANFRFPQAIRVNPVMPYWTYAPVVDDAFYIAPGAIYRSRYRYFVHTGGPDLEMIERIWRNWTGGISHKE